MVETNDIIRKIVHQFSYNKEGIAIVQGTKQITFEELDNLSSHYKTSFEKLNVKKGDIVAISSKRCIDTIAILIACIKLRATYIPIDPLYLNCPIEDIINTCLPKVIITDYQDLIDPFLISDTQSKVITPEGLKNIGQENLKLGFNEGKYSDCFCVIYTSGTLGIPKGIAKTYENINSMLLPLFEKSEVKKVIGQNSSLNFVLSIYQIFGSLGIGSTIVIINEKIKNQPKALTSFCNTHKITRLNFAPYRFDAFLDYISKTTINLPYLREISCTGSTLNLEVMQKAVKLLPNVTLINTYGSTEAGGIARLQYNITQDLLFSVYKGVSIKIIDDDNNELPTNSLGLIAISSPSVSHYFSNRQLLYCANLLIQDKWYYNTGDLGVLNERGELLVVGRNAFEIKVCGRRVQLEEIAHIIKTNLGFLECALILMYGPAENNNHLICFFTSTQHKESAKLKEIASNAFATPYVPDQFIQIEHMPLLPNDKINYQRLKQYYITKNMEQNEQNIQLTTN